MKILITGGAGYIGSHTCLELLRAGYEIVVLDNFSNADPAGLARVEAAAGRPIRIYEGDICDRRLLQQIFEQNEIAGVIHFAALKYIDRSFADPAGYYQTNVSGTITLLDVMQQHHCRNLVFSSSASVYGTPRQNPLTEETPLAECTNPYARTKRINELFLEDLCRAETQMQVIVLRYFNPAGADPDGVIGEDSLAGGGSLMTAVTRTAAGMQPALDVFGTDYPTCDGTGVRDYIHVCDLARAHILALQKLLPQENAKAGGASDANGNSFHLYNMGTGQGCSVLQLVQAFERVNDVAIPLRFRPRRSGDVASCWCDASKAERELGWKAVYGIEDMCRDAWNWEKSKRGKAE